MKTLPVPNVPSRATVPLYRQVEQYLRDQISSGALRSGDMLPSVKDLCEQFGGINHLTVRQAIRILMEDNLVKSVQGRGSFVTEQATRHKRIALVLPHLEDTLFIRIAKGAQEVFEVHGVRSLILDSRGSETVEADHIQNLQGLPLDGALIFPIAHSNIAEQVFKLKMDHFCFVLVDRYFEDISTPCVVVDNFQGGYESAHYLAKQGRRRVAWVGEVRSTSARLRLQGFQAALNDADIACPTGLIKKLGIEPTAPVSYHAAVRKKVEAAIDELLAEQSNLDAIVCCDDDSALAVLAKLRASKINVPRDVAVIGFDDVPDATTSIPPLTTVRQPMVEMGRQAALMLMEHMQDHSRDAQKQILPIELVVRESA
jgi:DNA-binding LacI/PurR family transcriptional regulator